MGYRYENFFLSEKFYLILIKLVIVYLLASCQSIEKANLENVTIIINGEEYLDYQKTVAKVLTTEVNKRTGFSWTVYPDSSNNDHTITLSIDKSLLIKLEGYYLKIEQHKDKCKIEINSSDKRGLLYGAGKFLRMLEWEKGFAHISNKVDFTSSPQYALRGHQFGYRNKANSWDSWTVEQFDEHFREQLLFGANSFENIPFQDPSSSIHFKVNPQEMEVHLKIKPICDQYSMPLMVEPLVFQANEKAAGYLVDGDLEKILPLLRQAVELGTDIIKADPCDDVNEYNKVIEIAGTIPVLVRGGGRVPDEEILTRTKTLIDQGAAGIVYGRNIIQHDNPKAIKKALMGIVHDDLTVEQALELLKS